MKISFIVTLYLPKPIPLDDVPNTEQWLATVINDALPIGGGSVDTVRWTPTLQDPMHDGKPLR